ncbi:MAG TPA: endolytic transglycosylase MltG [Bryobacteraceae bacterium]|nr:endolytic transglycosylase MltG [Bryobacteraceae bacterium]
MRQIGRTIWMAGVVIVAAGATFAYLDLGRPYKGFSGEVFYDLKRGTSTMEMARELAALGVVRTPWHFALARLGRPKAALQAGEYRFEDPASPTDVLGRIARGEVYYVELTIPEGSNLFEIAGIMQKAGLGKASEFRRTALDAEMIRDFAPAAPSLEGYLYPSTYQVSRRIQPFELCQRMTAEFRKVWKELGGTGDPHEAVTLASLVEKETGVPSERARVAAVFKNRLEAGIKLDCDPTVIYAALLARRWRGTIYRSDLDRRHPYNTYQFYGLPPGPIANPGKESLKAALNPDRIKAMYFVAKPDGSGGHIFSQTLAAHERAVASYRRETALQRGRAAPDVAGAAPAAPDN